MGDENPTLRELRILHELEDAENRVFHIIHVLRELTDIRRAEIDSHKQADSEFDGPDSRYLEKIEAARGGAITLSALLRYVREESNPVAPYRRPQPSHAELAEILDLYPKDYLEEAMLSGAAQLRADGGSEAEVTELVSTWLFEMRPDKPHGAVRRWLAEQLPDLFSEAG